MKTRQSTDQRQGLDQVLHGHAEHAADKQRDEKQGLDQVLNGGSDRGANHPEQVDARRKRKL